MIAVPLGALVGHTGRGTFLVAGLSNWLRALPELGLLTLLVLLTYVGLLPVVISLVILAIPPMLAGTYAGVRNVDRPLWTPRAAWACASRTCCCRSSCPTRCR